MKTTINPEAIERVTAVVEQMERAIDNTERAYPTGAMLDRGTSIANMQRWAKKLRCVLLDLHAEPSATPAHGGICLGQRVEWQDCFGRWHIGTISAKYPVAYDIDLDDGTQARTTADHLCIHKCHAAAEQKAIVEAQKQSATKTKSTGEEKLEALLEAAWKPPRQDPGAFVNAAGITAADMPATALKKLDAAYFASTTAQVQQEIWRDAMRYRWLRLQPVDGGPYGLPRIAIPQSPNAGDFVNDDDADESIDTAMLAAMLDAERAQEQAEQKKEAGADETDYTPGELDPTAPGQEVERG